MNLKEYFFEDEEEFKEWVLYVGKWLFIGTVMFVLMMIVRYTIW